MSNDLLGFVLRVIRSRCPDFTLLSAGMPHLWSSYEDYRICHRGGVHRRRYHRAFHNIGFFLALPGAAPQVLSGPSPDVLSGRSSCCICPQDKWSQLTPPNRLRSHPPAIHPSGTKLKSIKTFTNTSSTKQSAGSGKNAERVEPSRQGLFRVRCPR